MEQLKKCPFCGGEASLRKNFPQTCHGVGCDNEGCAANSPFLVFDTPEEAIAAWNTRKPMEQIVERLETELSLRKVSITSEWLQGVRDGLEKVIEIVKEEMGGAMNE